MNRSRRRRRPYAEVEAELVTLQARLAELAKLKQLQHDLVVQQQELELQNQELIESRHALEESHERYVELFDLAPVGLVTLDEHGIVCDINLRTSALLERPRLHAIGM